MSQTLARLGHTPLNVRGPAKTLGPRNRSLLSNVRGSELKVRALEEFDEGPSDFADAISDLGKAAGDAVNDIVQAVPEIPQTTTYKLSRAPSLNYEALSRQAPAPAPAKDVQIELPKLEDLSAAGAQIGDAFSKLTGDISGAFSGLAGNVSGALSDITDNAGDALSDLTSNTGDAFSGLSDFKPSDALSGLNAGDALSGITENAGDALSGLTGGIGGALSGLTGNAGDALSGLTGGVGGALSGLSGSAGGALSGLTGSAGGALSGLTGGVSEALSGLTSTVAGSTSGLTNALNDATQGATGEAAASVSAALESFSSAATSALAAASEVTDQALGSVPPEVRTVLVGAVGVAGSGARLALEHPAESAAVAGVLAVPVLLRWYISSFGGYSGELEPSRVLELLQDAGQEVVLVDVREEEDRAEAGVPELKLGARFKAAAVPLSYAETFMPRQANSREQLRLQLTAAFIAGIKQVKSPLTSVVIMDNRGSNQAKDLARALRKEGVYQAYVMQGGFQKWVSEGLATADDAEYSANPALLLKDELELIGQKAEELVEQVKNPEVGLPLLGGTLVGAVAIFNYHTTLQVIGLWGLAFSLYDGLYTGSIQNLLKGASSVASGAGAAAAAAAARKSGGTAKLSVPKKAEPVPVAALEAPKEEKSESMIAEAQ